MSLEKQLADTDSVYCSKVTSSNQSSIFISNLGDAELEVLFGADYKSDDKVRLRLDKRNLAFNAVAHAIDGKTWYKRKSSDKWPIDSSWLNDRLATLEKVFTENHNVFIASLNKDDHSTQRLYMKGMTALPREDGGGVIALRDFLFSGDVIVLTKLDNGDVSFEVKIPDNPIVEFNTKYVLSTDLKSQPRQLIIYGAPGTGKSWRIKNDTQGMRVIRTTFHPDSDYSTFVGAYKPSMEDMPRTFMKGEEIAKVTQGDECLFQEKRIVYKFVAQAFLKAYVEAWKKMVMGGTLAENAENAEGCPASENSARGSADATERVPPVYLVIEEINRGNCAQIFGDLFQLLDRNDDGFSEYEIAADDDLRRYLAEAFKSVRGADAMNCVPPEVAEKMERVFKGEILLLPENLFIWATMNTSDQSLFPIDSAFKRRWEWKYMPIHDAQKGYRIAVGADAYDWWDFLDKANALVQDFTDSEDKKLGYFFCKANPDGTIPLERFVGKVVFYLWNDVFRDVGFDHEVFADGNGGRLLFKDFFSPDGSPRAEAVRQFLANLGVVKVSTDEKTAEGASSADEEAPAEEGASA
mgnify:CR=1 FL=1